MFDDFDEKFCSQVTIKEDVFGKFSTGPSKSDDDLSGKGDSTDKLPAGSIKSYKFANQNGVEVTVISYGASIVSVKYPDKHGDIVDVALGFDNIESYLDPALNHHVGCILGRCANRIDGGIMKIDDFEMILPKNDRNVHHLHGGTNGFGRQIWESRIDGPVVVMTYLSEDGEEGYPGAVLTTIKFKLTNDNRLDISMRATTTKKTVVNLSFGPLFNLAGHDQGEVELRKHVVSLNCDSWTFAEFNDPVPKGGIRGVGGTIMDLRIPQRLGEIMDRVPQDGGFDHNFCVVRNWRPEMTFVGKAFHEDSGRFVEVYSDQPGVQFYTCGRFTTGYHSLPVEDSKTLDGLSTNSRITTKQGFRCKSGQDGELCYCAKDDEKASECDCHQDSEDKPIVGKNGAQYEKFGAFSIQPQNYPNAINVDNFPSPILRPGQVYYHDLCYKFGVQLNSFM